MNKNRVKEINLLAGIAYEEDVPLKLAKDLLKVANDLNYETNNQRERVKKYRDLISFHSNK